MNESGALERAFEEFFMRVMDSRVSSLREELREGFRTELAHALADLPKPEPPVAVPPPSAEEIANALTTSLGYQLDNLRQNLREDMANHLARLPRPEVSTAPPPPSTEEILGAVNASLGAFFGSSFGSQLAQLREDLREEITNLLAGVPHPEPSETAPPISTEEISSALSSSIGSQLTELRQDLREEIATLVAGLPRPVPPPPAPSSPLPAMNQGVARILQPTKQPEILSALLQSAAGFSGRCALFVRRGETFSFWRAEGFPAESEGSLRSVTIATSQPGIFRELSESEQAVSAPCSSAGLPATFEQLLGVSAGEIVHLFPIVVQGRVVATLYADAGSPPTSIDSSGLEILARVAGLSLETSAGRQPARPAGAPVPVARAAEAAAPPPPSFEEAPAGVSQAAISMPEAIEEAGIAAAEPAPAPGSFAASIPAAEPSEAVIAAPPEPDSLPEVDRDVHKKAHRFARVAVQDLLTYHKGKIADARKNKNLYLVLKEDIDKTRENYQKRFGQTAAGVFDYLHYEMVVKLAGNDSTTLGAQYPGPFTGG